MKKVTAVAALVLALAIGSTVHAGNRMGGMHGGCGNCERAGEGVADSYDQHRKFQADTIDLRQEMMKKRFEIQRENLKATTDNTKVAALHAEIKAIQAKIDDIRVKSGLPEKGKRDGECGPRSGKMGKGGCGDGHMGGGNIPPCGGK